MTVLGELVAFVTVSDAAQARVFYEGVLGLRLIADTPFALVFDGNGTTLRCSIAPAVTPAAGTVLGWYVDDMDAAVESLGMAGVDFAVFDGMTQDDRGIWTTPGGDQVAWFRDPAGNLLSLTELAR